MFCHKIVSYAYIPLKSYLNNGNHVQYQNAKIVIEVYFIYWRLNDFEANSFKWNINYHDPDIGD